ncbi:MAG: hypothetical protein N2036_09800, partial [Bryobacteraceae bacterium]|nr:hypothetical protein [Bryobacteraceae bacterium]
MIDFFGRMKKRPELPCCNLQQSDRLRNVENRRKWLQTAGLKLLLKATTPLVANLDDFAILIAVIANSTSPVTRACPSTGLSQSDRQQPSCACN